MRRWFLVFALLAASLATAAAAPVVAVRGRAAIEIAPIERTAGGGVVVRGRVYERSSGDPVAFAPLLLTIDGRAEEWFADADGRFERAYQLGDGSHDLDVAFAGDGQYSAAQQELSGFDVSKQPLELSLRVDGPFDAGAETATIGLRASSDGRPAAITATLHGGPEGGALRPLGQVAVDATGRGVATVDRALLGPPGWVRLVARFPGDATYDPATAEAAAAVRAETALTFSLREPTVAFEDQIAGSGRLSDATGAPLAGQPVALEVGGAEVARAVTDDDGTVRLAVDASELAVGPLSVQAVFAPTEPWLGPSRSTPLVATVAEARPIPVGTTLTAFAATAMALLAFVGLRTRPWQRWLPRQEAPGSRPEARRGPEPPRAGLRPGRTGLASGLRRASDHGFTGVVRSATTGRAIPGAALALRCGDASRALTADRAGAFAADDLAPGTWIVTVTAPGHCRERFPAEIPHRGELRDARVDLLPVRERIFQMYREAAAPLLPRPGLWGIWTPRQIVDHVRQRSDAPALSSLTSYVEEAYFSQRTPDEDALAIAAERVASARSEAAERAPDA